MEPIITEKLVEVKLESLEFALHLEKVAEAADGKSWGAKCTSIVVNGLPKEGLRFSHKSHHYLLIKGATVKLLEVNRTGHRITDPKI
jgi:hypothetical protein